MNKLVSRNPVQRFKQGSKVRKMQQASGGGLTLFSNKNGKFYTGNKTAKGTPYDLKEITPEKVINRNGSTIYKIGDKWYNQNGQRIAVTFTTPTAKVTEDTGGSGSTGSTGSTSFYQFGKMGGWNRSMGSSIDQDSLNMIKEMGMEGKSAQDIQNEINRVFGSNAVKVDNKWGNRSRAGLQALYERWKSLQPTTTETKPAITQPSITQPSITRTPEFQERLRQQFIKEETPEQQTDRAIVNNVDNLQFRRNGNYNKSQLRDYMRSFGLNPYDFKGSERKALRLWLNGQSNDNSLLTGKLRDLFVTPYVYKQGGQLPPRNIVERFKQRNFRLVAQ